MIKLKFYFKKQNISEKLYIIQKIKIFSQSESKGATDTMPGSIGSLATDIGSKALDAMWLRANVISNNIANNDTVGYKAKSVKFEEQLAQALDDSTFSASELSGIEPVVVESENTYGAGGNGVDLEDQMIELTRNQLQYSYLERGISDSLGLLMTAASEGR